MAVVGRIARAHGNKGQVIVNPETDFPDQRFQPGAELFVQRAGRLQRVTVASMRMHQGRPVIALDGVTTMNDAEAMAGVELRIPRETLASLPPGMYYHHDLVGCRVETTEGVLVGEVAAVDSAAGVARLSIRAGGREILVPLATDICRTIDIAQKRIVVDPPEGLLDL